MRYNSFSECLEQKTETEYVTTREPVNYVQLGLLLANVTAAENM